MNKQYALMVRMVVTAFTLAVGAGGVALGAVLTPGNEVNIQFNETSPTATPDVANGTIALGGAVIGKPGVFRITSFSATIVTSGIGIVFNPTELEFNSNTLMLSGSAAGVYVGAGGGTHTASLKVTGNNWTFTDTAVSSGKKQVSQGTYTAAAVPGVALYDDFSAPLINPDKWSGGEFAANGGILAEGFRGIQLTALRLLSRRYAGTGSDSGTGFSNMRLDFTNPNLVSAIRAKVQVTNFHVTGCAGNTSPSFTGAQIGGFFFNTGTPTPGNATGDVQAVMDVLRFSNSTDAASLLQISASVIQCTSADCTSFNQLPGSPVNLGKVGVGVPVRLFVAWDQPNKQFLFQRGTNAMVAVPYAVSDASGPGNTEKRLQTFAFVANCTTAPRPQALMDVNFDHVEVNTP